MRLKLHHCPNPDIAGGYYEPPVDPAEMTIEVNSVADASREYRVWAERNNLRNGNIPVVALLYICEDESPFAWVSSHGDVFLMGDDINLCKIYDHRSQLAETNCAPDGWKWA